MRIFLLALCALLIAGPAWATRVHVDASATGAADGSSRTDAFTTIQAGVTAAADADTIWVWEGNYVESVSTGSSDDNFTLHGVPDNTVTMTPDGTTAGVDGECLQFTAGTNLTVKNITFTTTGTTDHAGILWNVQSPLTVIDCTFDGLRTHIGTGSGLGTDADLTVTGSSFASSQTGTHSGWFEGGIRSRTTGSLSFTNCTFSITPSSSPSWSRWMMVQGAEAFYMGNCAITTGDMYDKPFLGSDNNVTDLTFENNSFVGTSDSGNFIWLNYPKTAGEVVTNLIVRFNTFQTGCANEFILDCSASASATQLHLDAVFYGNKFESIGTTGAYGLKAYGLAGGQIQGNTFSGYDATNAGGVQITSCRNVAITGNKFYNCDNGAVIGANSGLTNLKQYACKIVGNYFTGGGGDGAIKVDNYVSGAAPNDSLLTVAGNVFVDVAKVAAWVDTSDVTTTMTTLSDYQTTWPGLSTLDRGNTIGSSDGSEGLGLFRSAGVVPAIRKLGIQDKGLGN